MNAWHETLENLEGHLRYLREEGVQTLELRRIPDLAHPVRAAESGSTPPAQPALTDLSPEETDAALKAIAGRVAQCVKCPLHASRTNPVPGQGNPSAALMFVGEGPGEDEDLQGLAFVGRSGRLLTRIITAMGLTREQVFIGNIVKCRPPGNRVPSAEEMRACLPYLREQIAILRPKVIVALGATAVKGLLGEALLSIGKVRGQWLRYEDVDLMPTYHPSYILRCGGPASDAGWTVWQDMTLVLERLGLPVPEKTRAKK